MYQAVATRNASTTREFSARTDRSRTTPPLHAAARDEARTSHIPREWICALAHRRDRPAIQKRSDPRRGSSPSSLGSGSAHNHPSKAAKHAQPIAKGPPGRMGRTAVLSGNWYAFYRRTVMRVLITSQAALPPEISFAYASPPPQHQLHVPARAVKPERGEAAAPLRPSIHRSAWRNCLENRPRLLERASSAAKTADRGSFDPSWPPSEPLLRGPTRFSKQFRKGYSPKFV
jgi:hypothetical protein